jgi:hypothetical protein
MKKDFSSTPLSCPHGVKKYLCPICERERKKAYKKTLKGILANLRYERSPKGRATIKRAMDKYNKSEKGKRRKRNWWYRQKGKNSS